MGKRAKSAEELESLAWLREKLPPGSTVHCVLRHVSASGMQRRITFLKLEGSDYVYLDGRISDVTRLKRPRNADGLIVRGCGMDMGFHVVNSLSYILHGYPGDELAAQLPEGQKAGYTLTHRWI